MLSAWQRYERAVELGVDDPELAFYDPHYYELEVEPLAALPQEVRDRMLALEVAVKLMGPLPPDSELPVEEYGKQVTDLAERIERELRRMPRSLELATMPYADYLKTPEWDERRKTAYSRAQFRCQVCNQSVPLHAQHRTYERRGNEEPDDLVALCERCHMLFHRFIEIT
jgi:hypothetical protein